MGGVVVAIAAVALVWNGWFLAETSCAQAVAGRAYKDFLAEDLNWSTQSLTAVLDIQEGKEWVAKNANGKQLTVQPGGRVVLTYAYPDIQYGELVVRTNTEVPKGAIKLRVWEEYQGAITTNGERVMSTELAPEQTEYRTTPWVFRHVEVTIDQLTAPLVVDDIAVERKLHPVQNAGYFVSSDAKLNDIWRMSHRTLRLSMLPEAYVDSAQRDRALWVGDLREQSRMNLYTFADRELLDKSLAALQAYVLDSGFYPSMWEPHGSNGDVQNQNRWLLLDYVSRYAQLVYESYLYTGDTTIIERYFPLAIAQVEKLSKFETADGLLSVPEKLGPVTKWSSESVHGISAYQQVLYSMGLESAAEMATVLNQTEKAGTFNDKRARLISNSKERFFDGSLLHELGKQHILVRFDTNIFAVDAGWFEDEEAVIRALAPYKSMYGYKFSTEEDEARVAPLTNGEMAAALFRGNDADEAIDLIESLWGRMLEVGATSTWEFMDNGDLTGSVTHAWSGTPAVILPASLLGVVPVSPGFAETTITPKLGSLKMAAGVIPTPLGLLGVRFEQSKGALRTATLCVPDGLQAKLRLPTDLVATIGGKEVTTEQDGALLLPVGKSILYFKQAADTN